MSTYTCKVSDINQFIFFVFIGISCNGEGESWYDIGFILNQAINETSLLIYHVL